MQLAQFAAGRFFLPIDLDNQVRVATVELPAAGSLAGSRQRKGIGNLQRGRQKTGFEDSPDRPRCVTHRPESRTDTRPERRLGQQLQRGLGNDSKQALRAYKKAGEVEAGFVLVTPAAQFCD